MKRRVIASLTVAAALFAGCGGGDNSADSEKPQPVAVRRAEAACRDFRREVEGIARGALANPPSTMSELMTERLVRPSIPALERIGRRQQTLEAVMGDAQFNLYANLFDPIVVLAQERLRAGRSGNLRRSKETERMLTELGVEQRAIARLLGLRACDVDFQHVLISSLSE